MKLYLIIPSLGAGGAERVGVLLANGFVKRGHEVVVFSNLLHSKDYQLDKSITIIDISQEEKGQIEKWWHAIRVVRNKVKENPPNFFIGIMGVFSLVAYLACIGLHVPVIATMHNSFERPSYVPISKTEWILKFVVNKIFRKVTLLTNADALFIGKRLKNTVVMPNPLALEPIDTIAHRNNFILAVGRINDWYYKGFDVIIKSFAKLLRGVNAEGQRVKCNSDDVACKIKREGWKLQIAGTGSEENLNYLKQLCKENGVEDSVEFLGFRKDVEKLYQDASIFVLSSRYEAFGLVLIEAMSQGSACVACDYKGRQREIMSPTSTLPSREGESSVESPSLGTRNMNPDARLSRFRSYDGERTRNLPVEVCETGILCEPDDVEALAEAMKKMIEDDEYRESVRINAIERSKYYSIENTMNRWELLLNQILKE